MVALGLVFEAPELAYELKAIARDNIPCFWRRTKATLPHREHVAKVIAFVGRILIVAGVAGERVAEVKVNDLDVRIQECSDAKVTKATLEAGDAATSARTAHDEADAVKGLANEARTDAKDALSKARAAQRELERAESDASKAQTAAANALGIATDASAKAGKAEASLGKVEERAKTADIAASNALTIVGAVRQEAASLESELAQLRQQAADRVLDEYQQEQVGLKVQLFLGTRYELAVSDMPEAEHLLVEIDAAVSSAGWIYSVSENNAFRFIKKLHSGKEIEQISGVRGVQIGLSSALWVRLKPAADALAKVLNAEGIKASVTKLGDDAPSPNNIHIMVGSKP
jgi:hypothetical protein